VDLHGYGTRETVGHAAHCVFFGINESVLKSCAISIFGGREEVLKCRWKIGSTQSESLSLNKMENKIVWWAKEKN